MQGHWHAGNFQLLTISPIGHKGHEDEARGKRLWGWSIVSYSLLVCLLDGLDKAGECLVDRGGNP